MDLVIYDFDRRDDVIVAYSNCVIVPQRKDTIQIRDKIYILMTNPCFCYEKNTIWVFARELK